MSSRCLALLGCAALATSACTARAPGPPPPIDCTAEDPYEFLTANQTFEPAAGAHTWFGFGDCTAGDIAPTPELIEGGGRCGSTTAMVLRSVGHQDWGSGFGTYGWRGAPQDATGFDGLSFWARSPGATEKGIWLSLGDRQTEIEGNICFGNASTDAGPQVSIPFGDPTDGGKNCQVPAETNVDAGLPPQPGQCGNVFSRTLVLTGYWQLYTLPFQSFSQLPRPNMVEGIDTSGIYGIIIGLRKDARFEIWIDDIGFYQRKDAGL